MNSAFADFMNEIQKIDLKALVDEFGKNFETGMAAGQDPQVAELKEALAQAHAENQELRYRITELETIHRRLLTRISRAADALDVLDEALHAD